MLTRRSWFVYAALVAVWLLLIGWQVAEHLRFERSHKDAFINRVKDTSSALVLAVRSMSFFGMIDTNRLQPVLNEFVTAGKLHPTSVVVLNAVEEKLVSAGPAVDSQLISELINDPRGVQWDDKAGTVILMNLVDLGTNVILSPNELRPTFRSGTNGPALTNSTETAAGTNSAVTTTVSNSTDSMTITIAAGNGGRGDGAGIAANTNILALASTNDASRPGRRPRRRGGDPQRPFEKPPWMGQQEYESLLRQKGARGFIIVMPTGELLKEVYGDIWLRAIIGILATFSVAGSGLAWRNVTKTSELQIRLVRASELNAHLKEMNLAAAGLAHETRNPLNIVRGLAQMISRREDASPEVREKSRDIINETDRVTGQLNDFINYSRPREVRRAATSLNSVLAEVVRALNYDLDEKKVQLQTLAEPLIIEADEQLLRQALFNLVLNAIQAVPMNGEIRIRAGKRNGAGAFVEVADTGPGVAPEHRAEIFKPYFTTHEEGTGLGLAVVQQIVLAHGWEIECLPNQPTGAIFRITHLKPAR